MKGKKKLISFVSYQELIDLHVYICKKVIYFMYGIPTLFADVYF